jgi:hypothetical protein
MKHQHQFVRRLLLLLVLLGAVLTAQSASFAAEQESHQASQHCCRLCHIGPAPILPATVVAVVAPSDAPVWLAPGSSARDPHDTLFVPAGSRAPPA